MTPSKFDNLVEMLKPYVAPGKCKGAHGPNTMIPLPLRVSAAI